MAEDDTPENLEPVEETAIEQLEEQNLEPQEEPKKFSFLRKQPMIVKIGSVLILLFLLWLALPKCSTTIKPPEKTFLIALDATWYSLGLEARHRDMTTFFKVLLNTIAVDRHLKLQVVERGPNLFSLLDRKECDGVISVFPPPGTDEDKFIFSDSLYQLGFVLVVKKESQITSPGKVSGRIGIVGGAEVLTKIPAYPAASFFRYEDGSTALTDLNNNVIDGVVMETLLANRYLHGLFANKFKILYPPLINEGIELYLRKDEEAERFLKLFNLGLKDLRDSGQYRQLIGYWDLIYTGDDGIIQIPNVTP